MTFCSHGEEEYTLAEWNVQRYAKGDSPASGVTISDFSTGTGDCQQPAVLNSGNSGGAENSGILACSCNALVMATAFEAGAYLVEWLGSRDLRPKVGSQCS